MMELARAGHIDAASSLNDAIGRSTVGNRGVIPRPGGYGKQHISGNFESYPRYATVYNVLSLQSRMQRSLTPKKGCNELQ